MDNNIKSSMPWHKSYSRQDSGGVIYKVGNAMAQELLEGVQWRGVGNIMAQEVLDGIQQAAKVLLLHAGNFSSTHFTLYIPSILPSSLGDTH